MFKAFIAFSLLILGFTTAAVAVPNICQSGLKNTAKASSDLEQARKTSYRIEVTKPAAIASKAIEVKLNDLIDQLAKNSQNLKATQSSSLSPDQAGLNTARLELAQLTADLLALGAKRYEGTDAQLILARDAFARQAETVVKMTSKDSSAKLAELSEHREFVSAIVREKQNSPALTDAEATLKGVEAAYRESFVRKCKDGSCKVPPEDVLAAGSRARLQELKDCI